MTTEREIKWRLVLGAPADPENETDLTGDMAQLDQTLGELYDADDAQPKAGLGKSSPKVNRWLGDIRTYFPSSVVQIMMKDAMERLNLKQLLLEPEILGNLEPDVNLVSTLVQLNRVIPGKTRETARIVVRKVVEQVEKKLQNPMREAIQGALSRSVRNRRPKHADINWNLTIRRNLKHYQAEYQTIIPHELVGHGRKGQSLRDIILCVDQSGSMASSVVYSSILGAVMASIRAVRTHMVVFDTAVVDLTKDLQDPVELLFGTQLGGGTDINKAIAYCETLVKRPTDTILVLITDLYEGGNEQALLRRMASLKASGVQIITLLSLSDGGAPMYDHRMASKFAELDIPAFACTPDLFPELIAAAIKKEQIQQFMYRHGIEAK
jgi:Mg-chelatase subunit ChlD